MQSRKKIRIGDLLVQNQLISEEQLGAALAEQKRSGRKLGRTLIELGYVSEDKLLDSLSRQLQIPFVDLKHYNFNAETVQLLPETHARRFRAVVLDASGNESRVLVGMADPTDLFGYDEIARLLGREITLAVVRESDVLATIDTVYRRTSDISTLAEELHDELSSSDIDLAEMVETSDVTDAPVVKLLESLFDDALSVNASDIHIEPDEHVLRIRQRIDGILHEQVMKETRIASALVVRLKLMAGLDISEKRLPQDGRFNIRVHDHSIDVRISTLPVQYGESVVMRLLDQSGGSLGLDNLGMPPGLLSAFRRHVREPHGMVLVTGPTGSGKTTTLYAALNELNQPEKKIITAEDPVEYRLSRINQVQINTKVGLTFAAVLRSALRQDPDIVLIGEMRDQETAEIGLRAAMTGHMVLSTLHTNDAIATASRLIDMGCASFLVASALRAIVAQRLIRKICESCATLTEPDPQENAWLAGVDDISARAKSFMRGAGCPQCNNTGYKGRIGVYEVLQIDVAMADALRRGDSAEFAYAALANPDFRQLGLCALDYAAEGITTLEEVIRVAGEHVEDTAPSLDQSPDADLDGLLAG